MKRFLALIALLLSCSVQAAGQTVYDDYFEVLPLFWQQVYAEGGETLYCGQKFGSQCGAEYQHRTRLPHVLGDAVGRLPQP